MIAEDVVEEHQGFDLPEGLEYLKDAQNDEITVYGSGMGLDEFVHGVRNVMNKSNVEVNVEIINFSRANIHDTFHDFKYLDLTIHGCRLTLKIFITSAIDACVHYLDLSKNIFEITNRDWELIKSIGNVVGRNRIEPSIRKLNLKDCNFDETEKSMLVTELGNGKFFEI